SRGKVTHGLAIQYLDSLVEKGGKAKEDAKSKGLSSGTRNRHLAICRRFFKWCVSTKRLRENPFAGIDNLKEEDIEEIIYCTKEERDRILAVARGLGRKDWIAIPIAFYAGCRREEIFRLQWEDVNMESKRLIIRKSKTGERRTTPLAKELIPLLDGLKKAHGPVVELPDDKTWENHADRLVELVRERLCRPLNPDEKGNPSEVVGKRVFLYTPAEVRGVQGKIASMERSLARTKHPKKAVELAATLDKWRKCPTVAHDGGEWLPAERVQWNAWRHTFASLRVQAGVSIDKVSSWMGNSPEVCRKHYAQFMPRDQHDEDIDKEVVRN
ncbi:MAG: tyrosine-type recombinase/integrase, partial [Planctomycetaceae bacterium]|nr:tyrosine-type recombinase/integrase [Planctomycetaceae bacterium]